MNTRFKEQIDIEPVKKIIDRYQDSMGSLIPMLQDVEKEYGYVPHQAIEVIASELSFSEAEIYAVLSFYGHFHLKPRGRHVCRVCCGTVCHVMGAEKIVERLEERLGIKMGETTGDGEFSLEEVECTGTCAQAPVIEVDGRLHGGLDPEQAGEIINKVLDKKS